MSSGSNSDDYVYTRYITRNGKRIYHPSGGLYKFPKRNKQTDINNGKGEVKL